MTAIENSVEVVASLTRRQRWANGLMVLTAVAGLALGLLIKDQFVNATVPFRDLSAG